MSLASGKLALIEKQMIHSNHPEVKPGDSVRVHVKIKEGDKERLQVFEGAVIAITNTGSRKALTVRKISHGVGVERVFPLYSPFVAKIERTDEGRVRRSKIYYVRQRTGKAAKIKSESDFQ